MTITLNGEQRDFDDVNLFTVSELIERLGLRPQAVLVELNGEAIFQRDFSDRMVTEASEVEIVRMVAGG